MSVIFVGGSQRSGTTMLNMLLCQDEETNPMIAEASYLRFLIQGYKSAKQDFDGDTKHYFESPEQLNQFQSCITQLFLNRTTAMYPGCKHLVLKEPHLTMLFPELFELVPQSIFLLIMRDPRDVIASMVKVGEKMKKAGQGHFFQQRNMAQLSNYFKSFYAPSLTYGNKAFKERMLVFKYEDLVTNSDVELEKLRKFTGLSLGALEDDKMDSGEFKLENPADRHQPWLTGLMGREISADSLGTYRAYLSEHEIAVIEKECSDVMGMFNYS